MFENRIGNTEPRRWLNLIRLFAKQLAHRFAVFSRSLRPSRFQTKNTVDFVQIPRTVVYEAVVTEDFGGDAGWCKRFNSRR